MALQAAVFAEYTWEVFVYCWELQFPLPLLLLPYVLLAGSAGGFLLCCRADPGELLLLRGCSCWKTEPKKCYRHHYFDYFSCLFRRYSNKIKSRILG